MRFRKHFLYFITALLLFCGCAVATACDFNGEAPPFHEESDSFSTVESGSSESDTLQNSVDEQTSEIVSGEISAESSSPEQSESSESDNEEIEVCEHTWEIVESLSSSPTCKKDGVTIYQCDFCKALKREDVDALGHIGGEATCTQAKICTRCQNAYGETLGHIGGEATCTQAKFCNRCSQPYGETLGHLKAYHGEKAATCTESGHTAYYVCMREGCDYETEKKIIPPAHFYVDNQCVYCPEQSALNYKLSSDETYYICTGLADKDCRFIKILDEYNGLPVKRIAECAFISEYKLNSVRIGKNIEKIGNGAFADCVNLVEVYNFSKLEIVPLPDLTDDISGSLCAYAKVVNTSECESKIKTDNGCIIFNEGNEKTLIGYAGAQKQVVIPEGVTKIHHHVFLENDVIEEIIIADTVKELPTFAFQSCTALKSLTIGTGLERIELRAVEACPLLKEVVFKNAKGWMVNEKDEVENCMPLRSTLQDSKLAANYLTTEYWRYYWFCK